MLRSLMDLPAAQIEVVLNAANEWCQIRGVAIESDEGRRAVMIAVKIVSSRDVIDLKAELCAQLDRRWV